MDKINKEMADNWSIEEANLYQIYSWIDNDSKQLVWNRYLFWRNHLKIKKPLNSIELGCGYGRFSMLLGLSGEKVTLFDYNETTLKNALNAHRSIGLNPDYIRGDLLQIGHDMDGMYDMVCSFGTLEHFSGKNRELAFKSNARLLRKGGLLFFTVPNYLSLFYQVPFFLRKLLKLFPANFYEEAFLRRELIKYAKSSGIIPLELECTDTLKNDFNYWILENVKSIYRKLLKIKKKNDMPKGHNNCNLKDLGLSGKIKDTRNYFDKHFTYLLLFVGQKK